MSDARHIEQSLSNALTDALAQGEGDYISIADLLSGIKTRATAMLLVLFSLPNILPAIPGTSAITGAPLVLLTLQMALGQGVWLPRVLADRAIPRTGFLAAMTKTKPYFERVERMLHPRLMWASTPLAQRLLGVLMLGLSLIIILPIPFANALPAIGILIIAIGLVERDGLFILAGLLASLAAVFILASVYGALFAVVIAQITSWF